MDLHLSLTPEQEQAAKAFAMEQGKTLEEYAIDQILLPSFNIQEKEETEDEKAAWNELGVLLKERVERSKQPGGMSDKSLDDIMQDVLKRHEEATP